MVYDYIFCGFGLSALVVLEELFDAGLDDGKNILIIDPQSDSKNDKTWCFWEQGAGKWDFALAKVWTRALFKNDTDSKDCLSDGMVYKMLDSQKLFGYMHSKIANKSNIKVCYEKVLAVNQHNQNAAVVTGENNYIGKQIFSSIYDKSGVAQSKHPLLLQHFLGWYVKVSQSPFASDTAILMDFAIAQKESTRFMYVLPLSDEEFLIEFTLFSPELLRESAYELELKAYLEKCGITHYEITKKETGIIPMTTFPFWRRNTANILHIGSAGGWTKSSTGYTFNNARTKAKRLIDFLKNDTVDFRQFHKTNRFYWYDRLFVDVLFWNNSIGYQLFSGPVFKIQSHSL
jgi:lycopene beta-cyclase